MARVTCYAIIAIALVDFAYQRRNKLLDLRMTKQEVRDEMRNSGGRSADEGPHPLDAGSACRAAA